MQQEPKQFDKKFMTEFDDRTFIISDTWEKKTKVNITTMYQQMLELEISNLFLLVCIFKDWHTQKMKIQMYIICSYIHALLWFEQFTLKFVNAHMHCIQIFMGYIWL